MVRPASGSPTGLPFGFSALLQIQTEPNAATATPATLARIIAVPPFAISSAVAADRRRRRAETAYAPVMIAAMIQPAVGEKK